MVVVASYYRWCFSGAVWRWEKLAEDQPSLQHKSSHYGRLTRRKALHSERHCGILKKTTKQTKHLKDSQIVGNKILWSVWPQIQLSCLEETRHHSSPAQYCLYCEVWCWQHGGIFPLAGTMTLVRIEQNLIPAK